MSIGEYICFSSLRFVSFAVMFIIFCLICIPVACDFALTVTWLSSIDQQERSWNDMKHILKLSAVSSLS